MKFRRNLFNYLVLPAAVSLGVLGAMESSASAQEPVVFKIAYSCDYVPISTTLCNAWWNNISTEFEAANPGVKVQKIGLPGSFIDFENKISLLLRSPSTAPDLLEIFDQDESLWSSSGYLLPLNAYLKDQPFWNNIPQSIKTQSSIAGKVYGVSHAENDMALYYDKTLFKAAGIPMPWQPKTWADIVVAAENLKKANPKTWPLYAMSGEAGGLAMVGYGGLSFLLGSSDPTILDPKTGKWVVDSKGLRETIAFYKEISQKGLIAPASQVLSAQNTDNLPAFMPKHQVGIAVMGNWMPDIWSKEVSNPYYPDSAKEMGYANLPTINGGGIGIASALVGWPLVVYAKTPNRDLAIKFIELAMKPENQLSAAIEIGGLPSQTDVLNTPSYVDENPYRAKFGALIPIAGGVPADPNFAIWAVGFLQATDAVVLNPNMSVDDAIAKLKDTVTNQLSDDQVETR
ncbi:extracellular solute-binding protein [Acidisoma cellulosilytica]|uniref:Extracellular solute-binding protein n=1 Tax=Acidisoma cellulosilyticum TaxID=2802395 RepID=A0A963Z6J4_9PROT|nr:extracellular solute-binding protein [Acidisoma cellulosilyticum]MCB8883735.1 extracellular solute-binding protein [Acidisoma cellulosilyticum]